MALECLIHDHDSPKMRFRAMIREVARHEGVNVKNKEIIGNYI